MNEKKDKKLKIRSITKDKFIIISVVLLIIDVIAYFSLNKILNIAILFMSIMSIALFLVFLLGVIFEKGDKRVKNIDNLLGITLTIHILLVGLFLGQICKCGYHYFYIAPLIICELLEIIFYHIFVFNYKGEKNIKYVLIYFTILNLFYILFIVLSKVNMENIHDKMFLV